MVLLIIVDKKEIKKSTLFKGQRMSDLFTKRVKRKYFNAIIKKKENRNS